MGYKMVSYPLQERTGGVVLTTSRFVPVSVGFRLGSLCVYGMLSNEDHSDYSAPERTYHFAAYGDGDAADDYTPDNLVGYAEIEDDKSGAKQRVHVFCRRG